LEALRPWKYAKAQPTAAVRREFRSAVRTGACIAAMLLIVVPLLTLEADARGGGGGGGGMVEAGDMAAVAVGMVEAGDMAAVAVGMVVADTSEALADMAADLAGTAAE
jgi:hypothetical protein